MSLRSVNFEQTFKGACFEHLHSGCKALRRWRFRQVADGKNQTSWCCKLNFVPANSPAMFWCPYCEITRMSAETLLAQWPFGAESIDKCCNALSWFIRHALYHIYFPLQTNLKTLFNFLFRKFWAFQHSFLFQFSCSSLKNAPKYIHHWNKLLVIVVLRLEVESGNTVPGLLHVVQVPSLFFSKGSTCF